MATQTITALDLTKREANIGDTFASLAGKEIVPLPDRFRQLKLLLTEGKETEIIASWKRLLRALKADNDAIAAEGTKIIPVVQFDQIEDDLPRLKEEIRRRGAAVIRGVIPQDEARAYKEDIEDYVRKNPQTRGFPTSNPQVFELYWSPSQIRARSHPNLLHTQQALLQTIWHASSPDAPVSLANPMTYVDRLRIRQPGDAQFALGPHMDGGSVERWEADGYGKAGVYDAIWRGAWEEFDAWDAAPRAMANTNLYNGLGACTVFRAFQGWMSLSRSGAGEGTLLVRPNVKLSDAYLLLRPFFRPMKPLADSKDATARREFLDESNWEFTGGEKMASELQGAIPAHGQELPSFETHPHLELDRTMVHIPEVKPGDFVVWHCDTIHAVDQVHNGTSDSSVLYIPVCPMTETNALYIAQQKQAFYSGAPGPDNSGGDGEGSHVGRPTEADLRAVSDEAALQAMGFEKIVVESKASKGAKTAVDKANAILGF